MKWLLTLFNTDGDEYPIEWSGYMTTLARDHHVTSPKPFTPFAFGPLIDDIIVTTLDYCKNDLQSFGMNAVLITLDMQLYMVTIQVKWSDPEKCMGNTCNASRWDVLAVLCHFSGVLVS